MNTDWDNQHDAPLASLAAMGQRLRAQHGNPFETLDDKMVDLLMKLFDVPWVSPPPRPTA